jgi:hypothetical protein
MDYPKTASREYAYPLSLMAVVSIRAQVDAITNLRTQLSQNKAAIAAEVRRSSCSPTRTHMRQF